MSTGIRPVVVYPQSITAQRQADSDGSLTPLFIVLAVIAVLAVLACYLGQICIRRLLRPRMRRDHDDLRWKGDTENGFPAGAPTGRTEPPSAAAAAAAGTKGEAKPMQQSGSTARIEIGVHQINHS